MMNTFCVPIVVITKDRTRYLDITLKSLSATVPHTVPVFIASDGSSDQGMLKYLTTNERVSLSGLEFPNDHPQWVEHIGVLANNESVDGIAGKVNVIMRKVSAGIKNIGFAVKFAFDTTGASHVVKIEDDIIFKNGWYKRVCRSLLGNSSVGLLSGFRYFYGNPKFKAFDDDVELITEGYTGGPMMAVSRTVLERCPYMFVNELTYIIDNDDFWINQTRSTGLATAVTLKGECQHIGVLTEAGHKPYMRDGKIVKIDHHIFPPYGMVSAVAKFAGECNLLHE